MDVLTEIQSTRIPILPMRFHKVWGAFIGSWIRDHLSHIWVKDLIMFKLCPEILSVPEWNSEG